VPTSVKSFLHHSVNLWLEGSTETGSLLGPEYTSKEQSSKESHLETFLDLLSSEKRRSPRTKEQRKASQDRLLKGFGMFAEHALGFDKDQVNALHLREMMQISTQFASAARRFDQGVSAQDIAQALRNVWTMGYLQLLLGMQVSLTPAIFAYSMLYPYSDNYLDDPNIGKEDKIRFNERLRMRLRGREVTPVNQRERAMFQLISTMEIQFPRPRFRQVFDSLLAIHRAQERSTKLLEPSVATDAGQILRIGFEKGGCSVLADGYLVAGHLTSAQAEFLFKLGTVLQLVDDLQDVKHDAQDRLMTVFSRAAVWALHSRGRSPISHATKLSCLDSVTNQTFRYAAKILRGIDCFDSPDSVSLRGVAKLGVVLSLTLAAGSLEGLHSRSYLRTLEARSPFRFRFLRQCRKKYALHRLRDQGLVETYVQSVDADTRVPFDIESVNL
jgi:hypothetical protein